MSTYKTEVLLKFIIMSKMIFIQAILAKIEIHNLEDDAFFLFRCIAWRFLRIFWYFHTALLCSLNVLENLLLPSPLATKYKYFFSDG